MEDDDSTTGSTPDDVDAEYDAQRRFLRQAMDLQIAEAEANGARLFAIAAVVDAHLTAWLESTLEGRRSDPFAIERNHYWNTLARLRRHFNNRIEETMLRLQNPPPSESPLRP